MHAVPNAHPQAGVQAQLQSLRLVDCHMTLQDEEMAEDMGRQAREHVEGNFSRAKFGAALETIIRRTLA
jgi:hypothetical protein